jgi:hypothetical protein
VAVKAANRSVITQSMAPNGSEPESLSPSFGTVYTSRKKNRDIVNITASEKPNTPLTEASAIAKNPQKANDPRTFRRHSESTTLTSKKNWTVYRQITH